MFKIDDESAGRGIAYLDMATLPGYKALLAEYDAAPDDWERDGTQERVQRNLCKELSVELPRRAVLNTRWLWNAWDDFSAAMANSGGVIEASPLELHSSPSANLLIEPDGAHTTYRVQYFGPFRMFRCAL